MGVFTDELNKLIEMRRQAERNVSQFVRDHEAEFIQEVCETFNLDPERNQVCIYGHDGCNPSASFKDDSKWHNTQIVCNYGNGWVKWK